MTKEYTKVQAAYEETVRIKHVAIEPSLLGEASCFLFDGQNIVIKLPENFAKHPSEIDLETMDAEADVRDREGNIVRIYLYSVRVSIVGLEFEIPSAAANHRGVNCTLYNDAETRFLDNKSDYFHSLGRRAIDYWLRVVRWKTGLGLIDIDFRPRGVSPSGGSLINVAHGYRFFTPRVGRVVSLPKTHLLKSPTWDQIKAAVSAGALPPIWNQYLTSAERRIAQGDFRAAVIDLAISAEFAIRLYLDTHHSRDFSRKKMSNIFDKWNACGLPAAKHYSWFSDLRKLFEARNCLMHRGDSVLIDDSFCHQTSEAVRNLVASLQL